MVRSRLRNLGQVARSLLVNGQDSDCLVQNSCEVMQNLELWLSMGLVLRPCRDKRRSSFIRLGVGVLATCGSVSIVPGTIHGSVISETFTFPVLGMNGSANFAGALEPRCSGDCENLRN